MISKNLLEAVMNREDERFLVVEGELLNAIAALTESEMEDLDNCLLEGEEGWADEVFTEAAGALAGLPKASVKAIAGSWNAPGGENSKVTSKEAKAKSAAHVAITDGLNKGHHVVIKKGDQVVASIHPTGHDKKVGVIAGGEKSVVNKARILPGNRRNGYRASRYEYEVSDHTRGEAMAKVHDAVAAAGGYDKDVTVHHISPDATRKAIKDQRAKARKEDESNPHSVAATAARVGEKFADKVMPSSEGTIKNAQAVHAKAKEMHEQIAKHLDAGEYHAAAKVSSALNSHLNSHINDVARDESNRKKNEVKWDAESLVGDRRRGRYGASSWSKQHFVDTVRAARKPKGE